MTNRQVHDDYKEIDFKMSIENLFSGHLQGLGIWRRHFLNEEKERKKFSLVISYLSVNAVFITQLSRNMTQEQRFNESLYNNQ
jgi:hypothetical protein